MTIKKFLKRYLVLGCLGQVIFMVALAILQIIIYGGNTSKGGDWGPGILMVVFCLWFFGGIIATVYLSLTSSKREARSRQMTAQNEAAVQARKDWDTEKKEWDKTHCAYCKMRMEEGTVRCPYCGASKK
jgi:uncharacterized membrane protein